MPEGDRRKIVLLFLAVLVTAACGGSNGLGSTATITSKEPTASVSQPVSTPISSELLATNFDQGPGPFTITTAPEFSIDLVNGTYRIRILTEKGFPRSYALLVRETGAVAVLVDVVEVTSPTTDDPDLVGVACSRDNGDGYFFAAENNGGYVITKRAGGHVTNLKLDVVDSIPGGKIERLRLTCMGAAAGPTKLWASINGATVAMVNDPQGFDTFTTIALTLAADPGTEAFFDNVLARVPEPEDS